MSGTSTQRIGLALGAGGARGLAHIVVLEAFDELGLKPSAIAGASIGAIIGAAYAAGLSGRELREVTIAAFRNRTQVFGRLLQCRVGRLTDLFARRGNPVLLDGEMLLDLFWPREVPDRFEQLNIPFSATATDYAAGIALHLSSGPLVTAVAGSMAIPGLIRPVLREGRSLIDGGASDPLPYEALGDVDFTIAVDVAQGIDRAESINAPDPLAAAIGATQIMQSVIVAQKIAAHPPGLLLRPAVTGFRTLDFLSSAAIFEAAEPMKDEIKRVLDRQLTPRVSGARRKTP